MALWMNRAGRHGEWEQNFLDDQRIYLQWEEIDNDLSHVSDKGELRQLLRQTYPKASPRRIGAYLGQIRAFVNLMQIGDWVGLPSKQKRAIHFGQITGDYVFDATQPDARLRHYRSVSWFATNILRSKIPQDILVWICPEDHLPVIQQQRRTADSLDG